jgi:hypothetical protein
MNDSKRVWVWVGVVVVVIVAVALIWWRPTAKAPQKVASGPVPVYATQGQLVTQFPKNLIIDTNAAITGSYSINYSSSTNQYTTEYDSSSTVSALYKQYKSYLPKNGWTITTSLTTRPTFDLISAAQGNSQLQVVISTQGKGSQVAITYLVK